MGIKTNLNIYLLKNNKESIFRTNKFDVAKITSNITFYYTESRNKKPDWLISFFGDSINDEVTSKLKTSFARGVLIVDKQIKNKKLVFALSFGYGSTMLNQDVIEERFGLRTAANLISENSIKKLDKINIGGSQKNASEQMPRKSNIADFGFDIESDLITGITGSAKTDFYEGNVTGKDSLNIYHNVTIDSIEEFLSLIYDVYLKEDYKNNFDWIDRIQPIKNTKMINKLDELLIESINNRENKFWAAAPNIIEWEEIKGFKYAGPNIFDDIDIERIIEHLGKINNVERLKSKYITVIDSDDLEKERWQIYKCLYGEIDSDDNHFCINSGKWYAIEKDYTTSIDRYYENIELSNIQFINYNQVDEANYIADFCGNNKNYLNLDREEVQYGGNHSNIEICDVLSKDNKLIHIKKYSGSPSLSHLFNQGVNSIELIKTDPRFVIDANKIIGKLTTNREFFLDKSKSYEIIYAIISKDEGRPKIPFFSRISIRNAKRRIESMNLKMTLISIKKDTD